jgi:hypothetical protein
MANLQNERSTQQGEQVGFKESVKNQVKDYRKAWINSFE